MDQPSPLRLMALAACVAATAACSTAMAQPANAPASHPYALSQAIPGRYIVVFKPSVADPAGEAALLLRGSGGQLHFTYTSAIKGFAATLPDAALIGIRQAPQVDYVETDQTVALNDAETASSRTQAEATWGLDRIDQADRPLDGLYHYNYTASSVNAFVIDTGIRSDHVEFTGRILPGYSVISDKNGTEDCNGHGTHVSGTIGGTTWGVAKAVSLIPVRVLDCRGSGTWSGVIAGIDWVAASTLRPAVANMSLGGGASSSVDAAVAGAVGKGVTIVVAAGNSNADACNYSPARAPSAITVGATTTSDARAYYSNYGTCLDLFAPGSGITSAWNTSATATNTISGTSMASPHVAGIAALALATNTAASPAAVASFLTTHATSNRLSDVGSGSPNRLVYSLATGAPQEPPTQTVAVQSLTGSSALVGRDWRAYGVVTIFNASTTAVVPGATVSASFSPGGNANCVTGSTGNCTLTSGKISRAIGSTMLTITDVTGMSLQFQGPTTTILINRP